VIDFDTDKKIIIIHQLVISYHVMSEGGYMAILLSLVLL